MSDVKTGKRVPLWPGGYWAENKNANARGYSEGVMLKLDYHIEKEYTCASFVEN